MMGWMAPLRHLSAKLLSDRISSEWEPSMGEVTTIGLDLAKHVFQVHGVDAEGATVLRKQLRRAQVLAFFSRRFADPIRASSPPGLHQQAGHMTASDLCAARQMISCQAGAIHCISKPPSGRRGDGRSQGTPGSPPSA